MSREHYDPALPSVTELGRWAGYYDGYPAEPTGYYLRRGNFVDQCCTILAQGLELDDRTIEVAQVIREKPLTWEKDRTEQWIEPVAQFSRWLHKHEVVFLAAQQYLRNDVERYQGTYDLKLIVDGKLTRIDLKCGDCPKFTALQIAGYDLADEKTQRLGLQLLPDKAVEHWYKNHDDYNAFRLMVRWYWKSRDYR